ncbi:MAG: hypothetical protein A2901_01115 [Elusimicrobia bacterium RIFCSPLOWO2_01_FULL_54_10]|nr:MAG: hypothetical protein A2901_01115 [Elusimicrobia bacterium RIFCSPLOWO2_01_FULL_54_10]
MNMMTLTVEEVANILRLSPITVYRELVKRHIPGFKVGNQWRIREDILREWMREKSGWISRFDKLWMGFQKTGRKKQITEEIIQEEILKTRKGRQR